MSDRLTAMDVDNQEFGRKLRGYDPEQVDLFLTSVSDEIERLSLERSEMLEELNRARGELEDVRSRENALQKTLVTAQTVTEEMRERARREADVTVKEARLRADKLLQDARDQLSNLDTEITRAMMERETFERRLRGVLEQHLALLDLRREGRDDHDHLRVLPPKTGSEAG